MQSLAARYCQLNALSQLPALDKRALVCMLCSASNRMFDLVAQRPTGSFSHIRKRDLSGITCLSVQIGDQGHLYSSESSSSSSSSSSSNGNGASSSGSAVVFVEDTHKAGGGALLVHHGHVQKGDLHVGQMVSSLMVPCPIHRHVRGMVAGKHPCVALGTQWGSVHPTLLLHPRSACLQSCHQQDA